MKEIYVIGQKEKGFIRIYDDAHCVMSTLSKDDAEYLQKRLKEVGLKKTKLYKLVEVK